MGRSSSHVSEESLGVGRAKRTDTPFGASALVYVEVDARELGPQWPLVPEVRIDEYRQDCERVSAAVRRVGVHEPREVAPERIPVLMMRRTGTPYEVRACRARKNRRSTTSHRKTMAVKVKRAMAR
jgi:hypothetical protein